ncbi:hypothetical protein DA717_14355 [Piscirickettsiaceae bacterium NZ-RLO2]|nr:hypothetical protein DA717_14355 [Piscirickettsiaceae bacterium NZ-RLO2]
MDMLLTTLVSTLSSMSLVAWSNHRFRVREIRLKELYTLLDITDESMKESSSLAEKNLHEASSIFDCHGRTEKKIVSKSQELFRSINTINSRLKALDMRSKDGQLLVVKGVPILGYKYINLVFNPNDSTCKSNSTRIEYKNKEAYLFFTSRDDFLSALNLLFLQHQKQVINLREILVQELKKLNRNKLIESFICNYLSFIPSYLKPNQRGSLQEGIEHLIESDQKYPR